LGNIAAEKKLFPLDAVVKDSDTSSSFAKANNSSRGMQSIALNKQNKIVAAVVVPISSPDSYS